MKLKIELCLDNEAFKPINGNEAVRILREFCNNQLKNTELQPGDQIAFFDENGNRVGEMRVTK